MCWQSSLTCAVFPLRPVSSSPTSIDSSLSTRSRARHCGIQTPGVYYPFSSSTPVTKESHGLESVGGGEGRHSLADQARSGVEWMAPLLYVPVRMEIPASVLASPAVHSTRLYSCRTLHLRALLCTGAATT
ncbi:hypothetical protein IWZ00DRAFT_497754 [Phyllosticta capitalensis]